MNVDRRSVIQMLAVAGIGAAAGGAALRSAGAEEIEQVGTAAVALPNTGITGKVVVVGGGMAGTTAAKYLRLWGGPNVEVTMFDRNASYTSNIMSNMVLTGEKTINELVYGYEAIKTNYGINMVNAEVTAIDPVAKFVTAGGVDYSFDRLILAPGLAFKGQDVYGADYDVAKTPHAWEAGPQTTQLADAIAAMVDGDNLVITIPKSPYRCPPGPYERACVLADLLKRQGFNASQVTVLDHNPSIQAQAPRFSEAFAGTNLSGFTVNYIPNAKVTSIVSNADGGGTINYDIIDANGNTVTGGQSISARVINPIPPQKAPALLSSVTGLVDASGFAPVNLPSFESTSVAGVHIVGDACKTAKTVNGTSYGNVPKAGHIGNQEAKTCVDSILRSLGGKDPNSSAVVNSACYTPITSTTATWLSAVYNYDAAATTFVAVSGQPKWAGSATTKNFSNMLTWFRTLMQDTFDITR